MPLLPDEIKVLRYLGEHKSAITRHITRDLKMTRPDALSNLHGLAGKGLVSRDSITIPPSWSITDFGAAVLDAADQEPK
jgi:hypothetical protein